MAPRTSDRSDVTLDADQLAGLTAHMIHGMVQSWVHEGISPNTAIRLVPVFLIEEQLGVQALQELGIAERTLRRWREEVRQQRDALQQPMLPD